MGRPELPPEGLWEPGHSRGQRRGPAVQNPEDTSAAEAAATSQVQHAERTQLWGDLWRRVEKAEAEVKRAKKQHAAYKKKATARIKKAEEEVKKVKKQFADLRKELYS